MTKKDTYYLPHFDSNKVVTGTYDCRADKRLVVNVRDITTKKSIQQLYSRYIAEQCLGRYLSSEEEMTLAVKELVEFEYAKYGSRNINYGNFLAKS